MTEAIAHLGRIVNQPQMITPFGIALSCLETNGNDGGRQTVTHAIH